MSGEPVSATVTPIKGAPVKQEQPPGPPATPGPEPPQATPLVVRSLPPSIASVGPPGKAGLPGVRRLADRVRDAAPQVIPFTCYQLARLGPAGVAGIGATLAAVLIAMTALVGVRHASETLMLQLARAQAHAGGAGVAEGGISKLVATLPSREEIPAVIGLVLQQAHAAGVQLDTGHYAYSPPKSGAVARYELEFPVKASYPSVRKFIDLTLSAVPAAGLDKLRIEKKAVGDAAVSADIRFVVFVRGEPERP